MRRVATGGRANHPLIIVGLMAALGLGACGSDEPATSSSATDPSTPRSEPTTAVPTPSEPAPSEPPQTEPAQSKPQCSEVWVDGRDLPGRYDGCFEGEEFVKGRGQLCAFGTKIFTYDERFYAAEFSRVNETTGLAGDEAYQKALANCSG